MTPTQAVEELICWIEVESDSVTIPTVIRHARELEKLREVAASLKEENRRLEGELMRLRAEMESK